MVREINKGDSIFGFELERQNATIRAGSSDVLVVQCVSEQVRDDWLKVINDQIRDLKRMADQLVNPQGFQL